MWLDRMDIDTSYRRRESGQVAMGTNENTEVFFDCGGLLSPSGLQFSQKRKRFARNWHYIQGLISSYDEGSKGTCAGGFARRIMGM